MIASSAAPEMEDNWGGQSYPQQGTENRDTPTVWVIVGMAGNAPPLPAERELLWRLTVQLFALA